MPCCKSNQFVAVDLRPGSGGDDQPALRPLRETSDGAIYLAHIPRPNGIQLYFEEGCCCLKCAQLSAARDLLVIACDCDPLQVGNNLLQNLEPFCALAVLKRGEAR